MTLTVAKESIQGLFQRYPQLDLERKHLQLKPYDQKVISSTTYQLKAFDRNGITINRECKLHLLWEEDTEGWQIIAPSPLHASPQAADIAKEIEDIDTPSSSKAKPPPPDEPTATGYDTAVVRVCAPDPDFVRSLYRAALGRDPGPSELAAQVGRLQNDIRRSHLVQLVLLSPEYEEYKRQKALYEKKLKQ